jgi:titin
MGLRVAWKNESSNAAGIVLLRRESSSANWAPVASLPPRDGAYTDLAIQPATTYAYRLQAYDATGQPSAMSEEATGSQLPGSAPSGLLVAQDGMGLKLTWTNNAPNATGVQVFKRVGPTGVWNPFVALPNVPSVTDTEVTAGETYYYAVRAWAPGGVTEFSAPAAGFQSAAAAPSDLVALQDGMGLRLSWTSNAHNAAGFRVFRRTDSSAWTLHATIPGTVTSLLDTAVTFGERYSYYVEAYTTEVHVTFASNVASGTQDPASAPTGFIVTPDVGGVRLSWVNHARHASGTQVFRTKGVTGTWALAVSLSDPAAASYLDTDVAIGETYSYYIRSYVAASGAVTASTAVGSGLYGECDLPPSSVTAATVVDGATAQRALPSCTAFPHLWPSVTCSGGVCR